MASVVYRISSRIRTRELLALCQSFALPTVGPRLSTRSLWGYVADFVAEEAHAGKASSRLVLDIDIYDQSQSFQSPSSAFGSGCHVPLWSRL